MDRPKVTEDMILRIINSKEATAWDLTPNFASFKSVNNALFTAYALGDPDAVKICEEGKQTLHELIAEMITYSLADTLEILEIYDTVCDVDVFKQSTGCDLNTEDWTPYKVKYPEVYSFLHRKYEADLKVDGWEEGDTSFSMLWYFGEQDSTIRKELLREVERVNYRDELLRENDEPVVNDEEETE